MLYISTDITNIQEFYDNFCKTRDVKVIDLSNIMPTILADESDSIVNHHKECVVILGYLEPGWMLDLPSQTRIRKLFRKFDVAMVTHYTESIPFSWKTEINTIYTCKS